MMNSRIGRLQLPVQKSVSHILAMVATVAAASLLTACGGGSDTSASAPAGNSPAVANVQVQGTVVGNYAGATVCADTNNNGLCDAGEPSTTADAKGAYSLMAPAGSAMVAMVSTGVAYNDPRLGATVTKQPVVFRSPGDMASVISPLTTDIVRQVEGGSTEAAAVASTAQRLGVTTAQVSGDYTAVTDATAKAALLNEANLLDIRFRLATTMATRGDISPVTGKIADIKQAEQDAFNVEGVPRYDNLFVIILENETNTKIDGGPSTPNITAALAAGAKATSYHSTGHPSEPNYMALGSGDDWGVTSDDSWWCIPAGDTKDVASDGLPAGEAPCTNASDGSVHNIKNGRSIFRALLDAGMSYHVYSESMNPGMDPRGNSHGDASIIAPDNNDPTLQLPYPGMYAPRHNPSLGFDDVRSDPSFKPSQRTMGGGQWDKAFMQSPNTPAGYDIDQLGTDLASGDIANVNYLIPDLCDDMHDQTVLDVTGTIPATDCSPGPAILKRGDNYTNYLIKKIQASPLWQNKARRVGIVITFDEGSGNYVGPAGCCGWNSADAATGGPLGETGKTTVTLPILNYNQGNQGNGPVIFGVLTNQSTAPAGKVDDDAYNHVAFVRTLQDMFALADPGVPESYMNRSKYTESYIKANLLQLPEFEGSIDTHWDAVRPMANVFALK